MIKVIIGILTLCMVSSASNANDNQGAKNEALEIYNSTKINSGIQIEKNKGESDLSIGGIINFQGVDLKEQRYLEEGLVNNELDQNASSQKKIVDEVYQHQRNSTIKKNEPLFDKARNIQKFPSEKIDWIKGENSDCLHDDDSSPEKTIKICDDYLGISEHVCAVGQEVEVKTEHKYECKKQRIIESKACTKKLIVTIEKKADSDLQGVNPSSIKNATYLYPYMTIGRVGDDYYNLGCKKITNITSFDIKDLRSIEEFRIVSVGYDDYQRILVNGKQVYNGPFGGDRLEVNQGTFYTPGSYAVPQVYQSVITGQNKHNKCELGVNRRYNLDIDLIPYLKMGQNNITVEAVVGGHGESWVQIRTKQSSFHEIESWEEACTE